MARPFFRNVKRLGRRSVPRQGSTWRYGVGHRRLTCELLEERRLLATTLLAEGFEGAFPGSWAVNVSQSRVWDHTDYKAHSGSWSAHCASMSGGPATNTYVDNIDTYMERTVNLSGYGAATLSFAYWINSEPNFDFFSVKVNGNQLWSQSGSHESWNTQSLDLSAYCGQAGVTVRFEFASDASNVPAGDAGAWLDDITLTGDVYDLTGLDCVVPAALAWGQSFTLQGQVYNAGADTVTADFVQKFYLSNDQTWGDADDVYLGQYVHTADVPGHFEGPDFNVTLTLPGTPPAGYTTGSVFYVGMYTDANNVVAEFNAQGTGESNNAPGSYGKEYDWDTFEVLPDLRGGHCDVLADNLAWGRTFTLRGQVRNDGSSVTTDFVQKFYLSNDAGFHGNYNVYLGSYTHTADVSGYSSGPIFDVTLTLPATPPDGYGAGSVFYIGMQTDANGSVSESNELNNYPPSCGLASDYDSFSVPPDLYGYDCYVPDYVSWGDSFTLQGRVGNFGSPVATDFVQKFYLSNDLTWRDADDVYLGQYLHTADVPGYGVGPTFNVTLTLPGTPPSGYAGTGPFYVGMFTDANDNVLEWNTIGTGESNNTPGSVGLTGDYDSFTLPADLQACYCNVISASIAWGESFSVQAQVSNQGSAPVTTDFVQKFYLSSNSVWGDGEDVYLGQYSHTADVPAYGQGPLFNVTLTLPGTPPAGYTNGSVFYIGMYTDATNVVPEFNAQGTGESNNAPRSFGQYLDYDGFSVLPDLRGADCEVPYVIAWGEAFTLQGQVRNNGSTVTTGFVQKFYLSNDLTWGDADDVYLGQYSHPAYVQGYGLGPLFWVNLALPSIPPDGYTAGCAFYVGMCTDANGNVAERNAGGTGESNNAPGSVGLGCDYDVFSVFSDLSGWDCYAPDSIVWGESFTLQGRVLNDGSPVTASFVQKFYLSNDLTWGDADDVYLGQYSHPAYVQGYGLGPQFNVTLTLPGTPPAGYATGSLFYIGMYTDANNDVSERNAAGTGETNNVPGTFGLIYDYDSFTVLPDLYGNYCTVPGELSWGEQFTLHGQVGNRGGAVTTDFVQRFCLSNDLTWGDADDVYLGQYSHTADVPGSSLGPEFTVTLRLPATPPAGYTAASIHIGMYTDWGNTVAERNAAGTGESNNTPGSFGLARDYDTFLVLPDLNGYWCYVPDPAGWGRSITVQGRVYNDGPAVTDDFVQTFYLSNDLIWGDADDVFLGFYNHMGGVAAYSAGPAFDVSLTLPRTPPAGYTGGGPFYIGMYTDAYNDVTERNSSGTGETNNAPNSYGLEYDYDSFSSRLPWTVMIYLDGDNNLENCAVDDFLEMAQVNNPNAYIVVQFDRADGHDTRYGDWTDTRRGIVMQNDQPDAAWGNGLGELNMGSPTTLQDFVAWAQQNYPGEQSALILWDHGGGWKGGVCVDSDSRDVLSMSDLHQALGGATGSDALGVIGMDACLMAGLEVAYEIHDSCRFFVGSAETEPGDGWEYSDILAPAKLSATTTPDTWAAYCVTSYGNHYDPWNSNPTLMAADMADVDSTATAVTDLADVLTARLNTQRPTIADAWAASRHYSDDNTSGVYYQSFIDLYDFCDELNARSTDAAVRNQAQLVLNSVAGMVGAHWCDAGYTGTTDNQRCFSLYFPSNTGDSNYGDYDDAHLHFLADANQHWDEFLDAYFTQPTIASLAAAPDPVVRPNSVTLTADGVSDPDGTVVRVRFYRETNGTPGLQTGAGADTLVGTDNSDAGGWTTTFATAGLAAGAYTYYAQATDNGGIDSPADTGAASTTNAVQNAAPRIDSLAPAPNPVARPRVVTLTATGVTDLDGFVQSVAFYRETNGTPGLQTGPAGDSLIYVDTAGGDGWQVSLSTASLPAGTYVCYAQATDNEGATSAAGTAAISTTLTVYDVAVVGRHIFYNHSYFDGNNAGADDADDNAVATDKQALLPGHKATFANLSSFSRGLNGIMVDIAGLADPGALSIANDLQFKIGNDDNPLGPGWTTAPAPTTLLVRPGKGDDGSDRVTLIWADNAIPTRKWLQVTVKATAATGLAAADVFYFGSSIGDVNGNAVAAFNDMSAIYQRVNKEVPTVASPYDINRDHVINFADMSATYQQVNKMPYMQLITPAAAPPGFAGEPLLAAATAIVAAPMPVLAGSAATPAPAATVSASSAAAHAAVMQQAGSQGPLTAATASAGMSWLYDFDVPSWSTPTTKNGKLLANPVDLLFSGDR